MNILAYGPTTAGNYTKLQRVHDVCLEWAKTHGIKFAPQKYVLIYFTRRQKAFDLTAGLTLQGTSLEPQKEVRVLGV